MYLPQWLWPMTMASLDRHECLSWVGRAGRVARLAEVPRKVALYVCMQVPEWHAKQTDANADAAIYKNHRQKSVDKANCCATKSLTVIYRIRNVAHSLAFFAPLQTLHALVMNEIALEGRGRVRASTSGSQCESNCVCRSLNIFAIAHVIEELNNA